MLPIRHPLSDGRWHWQHGPIDLVIGAEGEADAVQAAHEAAWARFQGVLRGLVAELPLLRRPLDAGPCPLQGAVAQRMWSACAPYAQGFITPMAAVAGAVAETLIEDYARDGVRRAWINNGGDIALHLAPGEAVRVGVFADLARVRPGGAAALPLDGRFAVDAQSAVRGVATSGWRGRSFSLGIADSVTVLARTASQADAAATIIANAVDVPDAAIERRPARELRDDSDLGAIPVTVHVPALPHPCIEQALRNGAQRARELKAQRLIEGAVLCCQGTVAVVAADAAVGSTLA